MVASQDDSCDGGGESFRPMPVDIVLDNDDVLLRQAGTADPVVRRAPGAADLYGRGDGFFLDFNGISLDPGCVYEQNLVRSTGGDRDGAATVYAHVVAQEDRPGKLAPQFWLYWYYKDWNNKHESDWEFVQLIFDASDAAEAIAEGPVSVGYAQHEGGERSDWDDGTVEREEDHPIVWSSPGSHASYYTSSVFLGRKGTEGFGCDTTAEDATALAPAQNVPGLRHPYDRSRSRRTSRGALPRDENRVDERSADAVAPTSTSRSDAPHLVPLVVDHVLCRARRLDRAGAGADGDRHSPRHPAGRALPVRRPRDHGPRGSAGAMRYDAAAHLCRAAGGGPRSRC